MNKIAAVISGVLFVYIAAVSAQASEDEGYEHHEGYEHGSRYYNPYGYNDGSVNYNSNYRNHEVREYGRRYMNSAPRYSNYNYGSGYIGDDGYRYNNYGNHELHEYRR